jgi:hypothetical protein
LPGQAAANEEIQCVIPWRNLGTCAVLKVSLVGSWLLLFLSSLDAVSPGQWFGIGLEQAVSRKIFIYQRPRSAVCWRLPAMTILHMYPLCFNVTSHLFVPAKLQATT